MTDIMIEFIAERKGIQCTYAYAGRCATCFNNCVSITFDNKTALIHGLISVSMHRRL